MRLFRIGGTDIVCSPLLLLALPAAYVLGRVGTAASAFCALTAHEAAHAAAAKRAGCRVDSIELQPFGFVARLECGSASAGDAFAVFAAGPVISLCLSGCAALIAAKLGSAQPGFAGRAAELMRRFSDHNLLLAAVNLLPALPLDGGRLIRAVSEMPCRAHGRTSGKKLVVRLLSASGALIGAAFTAAFFILLANGAVNPTLIIMGVFLFIAAISEGRSALPIARHKRLGPRDSIGLRQIAAGQEVSLAAALRMLPRGEYAVITVLDASHNRIGSIDEAQLAAAAEALGAAATLRSAVAYCGRKVL